MNLNPFPKCVCPSCFEEIYLGECAIVSGVTSGKILKKSSTGILARMYVEPLTGRKYTLEKARRQCTNCTSMLPKNIESVASLTLAVVGDTFSGKSHYLAALIHQLKTEWMGVNTDASILCVTQDVEKNYKVEELFNLKNVVPGTLPGTNPTREPLVYKLVMGDPSRSLNLTIYDVSGEDFNDQRRVEFSRFIFNANAFIFVADPFSMASITSQLPQHLQTPELQMMCDIAQKKRAAQIFSEVIEDLDGYHRKLDGLSLQNKPVAVMLSKADLLKELNPSNSYAFMKNPTYGSRLDLRDLNAVDREVRAVLKEHKQSDLLAATGKLEQVRFFATSATGELPDASGSYTKVEPCRCLDPLLWILYELGVIREK